MSIFDNPQTRVLDVTILDRAVAQLRAAEAERDDLRRRLNIAEAALAISESLNEALRADNVRLREEARDRNP